jgi:hypothetical protein
MWKLAQKDWTHGIENLTQPSWYNASKDAVA